MCCMRLAGNTGCKNDAKIAICAPSHNFVWLHLRNYRARIDNRKKNLLSSNISATCPYNMVNFGLLAAEIVSLVWGIPANFNGFHDLAALLHSQTVALNRGRHLYSAGRPSRWALAHISSLCLFDVVVHFFWLVKMCAFVVLGLVFPYQAKRLAWGMSPKMTCFVSSGK